MSRVKEKYLDDEEKGYISGKDFNVCGKHFDDKDILKFIREKGDPNLKCSFCDETEDEIEITNKITWDDLLGRIVPCIKHFYDDPANGLSYVSAEGGYLGNTYDTLELLQDVIGIDAESEVVEEIANSITQEIWTEAEFYGETYTDHLNYTWEAFSKLVKYKVRYVFNDVEVKSGHYDLSHKPFLILKDIGRFISQLNLIITVPEKSNFFNQNIFFHRARQHKVTDKVSACQDIGSAPNKFARANRFSAEGISIFYGAEDEDTAIKEVINTDKKSEFISIGKFYPAKGLNLVDLRNISKIGFFDTDNVKLIEPARFLRMFVASISQKLEKDGNERIEYVPSQIVTEYLAHVLPSSLKRNVHGIVYKSVQNEDKDCYAIFADRFQCSDEGDEHEDTLLVLSRNSINKFKVSEKI
jgi:hypothetical protein